MPQKSIKPIPVENTEIHILKNPYFYVVVSLVPNIVAGFLFISEPFLSNFKSSSIAQIFAIVYLIIILSSFIPVFNKSLQPYFIKYAVHYFILFFLSCIYFFGFVIHWNFLWDNTFKIQIVPFLHIIGISVVSSILYNQFKNLRERLFNVENEIKDKQKLNQENIELKKQLISIQSKYRDMNDKINLLSSKFKRNEKKQ